MNVLSRDVVWNLASFATVAAAGMLAYILIARDYGPAALGTFNQAVALYIAFSQISTAGIHLAILQRVSTLSPGSLAGAGGQQLRSIISVSFFTISVLAFAVVTLGYALSDAVAIVFHSQDVRRAWQLILPGLWFFSLNKLLICIINALRHMRAFAVAQASRYLLMMLTLVCFIGFTVDGSSLALIVTLSEAVLFVALVLYVWRLYPISLKLFEFCLARDQLAFGLRAMWGNAFTDLNARIDVIILGIFTNDRTVGVYSLVGTIFDGLIQSLIVLRNVFNPRIGLLFAHHQFEEFRFEFRRFAIIAYTGTVVLAIAAIIFYPFLIEWIIRDSTFQEGFWPLVILVAGVCIVSGWLPLDMLLLQAGDPTAQSLLRAITVATNIILGIAFVPLFGMMGAASASAISLAFSIAWLKVLARIRLGITI